MIALNFNCLITAYKLAPFKKIVSVGMLEHVGPRGLPIFFDSVRKSLAPGGVAVIHTIAMHHRATPVNRWLTRYIFPGGYFPSIQQLISVTEGVA